MSTSVFRGDYRLEWRFNFVVTRRTSELAHRESVWCSAARFAASLTLAELSPLRTWHLDAESRLCSYNISNVIVVGHADSSFSSAISLTTHDQLQCWNYNVWTLNVLITKGLLAFSCTAWSCAVPTAHVNLTRFYSKRQTTQPHLRTCILACSLS